MGGQQSHSVSGSGQTVVEDKQSHYYVLQDLAKMSFQGTRQILYFWVDPRIYSAENQKYLKEFKMHFQIESFSSLEAFKERLNQLSDDLVIKLIVAASLPVQDYVYMQNERRVAQVLLFCSNQEGARLLQQNFKKIAGFGLRCSQVVQLAKELQQADLLLVPTTTLLLMLPANTKRMNRQHLLFDSISKGLSRVKGKEDFVALAKKLCPKDVLAIEDFERSYQLKLPAADAHRQIIDWAMRDWFCWKLIEAIPKSTTDPRRLAYIRLPFGDLFVAIEQSYRQMVSLPQTLWIVVSLSVQEREKLRSVDPGTFFLFTSFIRGFTRENEARVQHASSTGCLFQVRIPSTPGPTNLDFGFVFYQQRPRSNVLFNSYNYFELLSFDSSNNSGVLVYGSLSRVQQLHNTYKGLTESETTLLMSNNYLQVTTKPEGQAAILHNCGFSKESLQVLQRRLQYLLNSKKPLGEVRVQRGDCYRHVEQYEEAEKQYKLGANDKSQRNVALSHLAELYFLTENQDSLADTLAELEREHIGPEESFRVDKIVAQQAIQRGKYQQAEQTLETLRVRMFGHYGTRAESVPMLHEVCRDLAICKAKLHNYNAALSLLEQTKICQQRCEGQSPASLMTEITIRSILAESSKPYQSVQIKTTDSQKLAPLSNNYLNQSTVFINEYPQKPNGQKLSVGVLKAIDQSSVCLNIQNPQQNNKPPITALDQSTICLNIDNLQQQNKKPPIAAMKVLDQSTICLNIDTPQQKLAPPKVRSIEQSMVQMDL